MLVLIQNPRIIEELENGCFGENAYEFNMLEEIVLVNQCFLIQNGALETVGYLILMESGDELELIKIGVLPKFRRQGYAKQAVLEVFRHMQKNIFLEVSVNNLSAIKLYKDCGFIEVGYRKNYYKDGSDATVMKLNHL